MNSFLIKPHSKIGVFAPSSYVEAQDIEAATAFMQARGFDVFIHPQTLSRYNQSAGTHTEKIDALNALYRDPSIDIIWAAGGGNRCMHILEQVDYDLIRAHPKPMIGFSDVSALLNVITAKTGIVNIHGPVFKNLPKYREIDSLLSNNFTLSFDTAECLKGGSAHGVLYGGNLSVFQYLPTFFDGTILDGALLFLEDCNEELSRIDRMLCHLKRIGVFEKAGGLIFGEFSDLRDSSRPFGFTLKDIITEHTDGLDIPVIMTAPFGHGAHLYPILIGAEAHMDEKSLRIDN